MSNASINTTILPEGYTRLKYIEQPLENSGYFKSGVYPTSDTRFTVDFMAYDAVNSTSYHCLFGLHLSTATTHYYYTCAGGSGLLKVGSTSVQGYFTNSNRVYADYSGTSYVCNGTTVTVSGNVSGTDELPLFCKNYLGNMTDFFHGRLYYLQFREGEQIIRNYVPCKDSNNVVGLFETVNWEFVTGETEDAFAAGPIYPITPQVRADNILSGVEDVRAALKEYKPSLGDGMVTTLGDDVRAIRLGSGMGFQLEGEVRHSEEVEVEVEDPETGETTTETVTEYSYPVEEIFNGTLIDFAADYIWTDVIDNLGELTATTVLSNGNVKFTLDTGITVTVDPAKTYIRFKDPVVENIIATNWGTDGRITLAQARAITGFNKAFADNTEIKYFNEFKYFDNIDWPISYPNNNSNQRTSSSNEGMYGMFSGCTSLEEIKLSPNHTSLGFRAFYGCSSLKKLDIPSGFLNLGAGYLYTTGYFHGCTSLEELIMPDSILQVGSDLFFGCTNLKKVRWSSNCKYKVSSNINTYTLFRGCTSLETIENFPHHIENGTNIPTHDFNDCPLLDTTALDGILNEVTSIGQYSFGLGQGKIFQDHNGYLQLPECTSLSDHAFRYEGTVCYMNTIDLPKMTSVYMRYNYLSFGTVILNEDVTQIKVNAFANNGGLCEVILPAETPPALAAASCFADGEQCAIYVPAESVEDYKEATNWSSTTNNIVKRIHAYKDPSTATFCEIPSIAPVPEDYTRMSWIGGGHDKNGTYQHGEIDLDYAPSKYAHLLMDVNLVSSSNTTSGSVQANYCAFLGATDYVGSQGPYIYNTPGVVLHVINNANPTCLYQISNDGKPRRRWAFNPLITGEPFFDKRTMLKINRSFIQFHGETHQKIEQDNDWAYPVRLFGWRTGASSGSRTGAYSKSYIKMYRFCIFEPVAGTTDFNDVSNYEIVRDYIPCMRNSDGRYGVWERMTGAFFTTAVTTSPYNVIGSMED